MIKRIIITLVIALIVIQAIKPEKNEGEIYTDSHIAKAVSLPSEVNTLLVNACYDCHSNHTTYPWYSNIQPLAWWLNNHVQEGKDELNFSAFKEYSPKRQKHKLDEIAEMVREKEMPLFSYTLAHSSARLNPDEIELLAMWALHSKDELVAATDTLQQQ
jgi:hypothetical protein